MPGNPVFSLILGVLAALSWWLYKETSGEAIRAQVESENTADAFVKQMIVSTINEQGNLEYRLSADHAEYFDNNDSEMLNPALMIMREQGPPWHLKANRARITNRGKSIELFGNVDMRREPNPGQSAVRARTSRLMIQPDKHFAETDASVRLQISGSQVTADGMRAFLKQGRVELLSGVTGRYEKQDN